MGRQGEGAPHLVGHASARAASAARAKPNGPWGCERDFLPGAARERSGGQPAQIDPRRRGRAACGSAFRPIAVRRAGSATTRMRRDLLVGTEVPSGGMTLTAPPPPPPTRLQGATACDLCCAHSSPEVSAPERGTWARDGVDLRCEPANRYALRRQVCTALRAMPGHAPRTDNQALRTPQSRLPSGGSRPLVADGRCQPEIGVRFCWFSRDSSVRHASAPRAGRRKRLPL
jgi:hypothetical protein